MRSAMNPLLPAGYDVLWAVVLVVLVALAATAVVQLLRARQLSSLETGVWLLVIVLLPVLGPLAWFVSARRLRQPAAPPRR